MTYPKSRRRKGKPYDPTAPVHDRRATELNRGIGAHVTAIEVDDPYEAGAKIAALRNLRNDPLARLHAHRQIDEAQYHAGRAFQHDFETAERGPRAIDPGKEAVDGGLAPEPITEAQQRAARSLAEIYRDLGADGSALAHDVLVSGHTMKQVAQRRSLIGERWEKYFGMRFQECLDRMAKFYGFAMGTT